MVRMFSLGHEKYAGSTPAAGTKIMIMEYLGNIIAVTVADLTRSDDGDAIMTLSNYQKLAHRGNLNVLRPGKGLGHPALIEFASLPERFRQKFVEKYGDPQRLLNKDRDMLKYDEKARAFYAEYRLEDGSSLKGEHQEEYLVNASVLNHLISLENTQRSRRNMSGNSTPLNWDAIYQVCEKLRDEYFHTLPKNTARLREKIRQYKKDGYACLVSGKLSNANSTKITAAAGRWIIAQKRSRVPVLTVQQIYDKYNAECASHGWKPLRSVNTLVQFLDRPEVMVQWKDTEQGELMAKSMFTRKFNTIMPSCRDAVWYGDGTKVNLYYKQYVPGQGYRAAVLQAYEVIDAYSECFLGCNISDVENFESMYEACRSAIENSRHLPVEMVFDNQGGTRRADARAFLEKIARLSRPTTPNNPTSKSIESIFGRFQAQVLHKWWFFTGQNITARNENSRANAEFIMSNVDKLPTREELISIYYQAREEWNSLPHPNYLTTRRELYAQSVNAQSIALTDVLSRELFWLRTKDAIAYTTAGISITIDRQKYTYEVLDAEGMPDVRFLSNNSGRKFIVQYDPHDMSKVRLCNEDKNYGLQYVCDAYPYIQNHRAMMDQQEGERSFIARQDAANKKERVRRDIMNHALEYEFGVAPEQHGLQTPRLKGISNSEYERFADEIRAEEQTAALGLLPKSMGQLEKEISNFDPLSAYDKM